MWTSIENFDDIKEGTLSKVFRLGERIASH